MILSRGIGIVGGAGRMGRAIAAEAEQAGVAIAGAAGRADDVTALARSCDVLVDFSVPAALGQTLAAARENGVPVLVGTTGLAAEDHRLIDDAATEIAVIQAANTSLGITLLASLLARATAALGPGWDVEIVEMHHRAKRDAPSGTALLLGEAAARGGADPAPLVNRAGARPAGIGYASLRGGSVAGDHLVVLAGEGERIELGHRAESRAIFARGALRAALWLAGRPPGRHRMEDVLGLP